MKLPEEIKKGLAYCDSRDHMLNGCAGGCPYWCDKYGCHSTEMKIDALAYIRQLEQRIVEADKTYSHWISVKERGPEKHGYYLVACEGEDIPRVLYFRGKTWAVSQSHYHVPEYWVELPKPPKEE